MKKIKTFRNYTKLNESLGKKLPSASGDPDTDEEIFFFSTENQEKSLVLNLIFEMINISVESGKKLKGKEINADDFFVTYKPGDKNVCYNYEFWTEDEEIVKKTSGHYKGHEWRMEVDVPSDIIEKLYNGEINNEDAEKRIKDESEWRLRDGMDPAGLAPGKEGGWQIAYSIGKFKQDLETQKQKSKPSWIQKIKNFFS
jgi:hypothetical protein